MIYAQISVLLISGSVLNFVLFQYMFDLCKWATQRKVLRNTQVPTVCHTILQGHSMEKHKKNAKMEPRV
jgi:hypothetical protein